MSEWSCPAQRVVLARGDIHVWRISLTGSEALLAHSARLLSPDEQSRAARFRLERDRRRYLIARSALRTILAGCLDLPPEALRFDYGPQGKPALSRDFPAFAFNVSHSDDLALIAVRDGGPVGIDVERVRPDIGVGDIADRFFCPAERAWLNSLAPERRSDGFFCLWTRKEAYIKARGSGLWHDLAAFDVSQSPPHPVRLNNSEETDKPWFVQDLTVEEGFRAALVVEGAVGRVRTWHMPSA